MLSPSTIWGRRVVKVIQSDAALADAYWRNFVAMWQEPQHSEEGRSAFTVVDDGAFLRIYSHQPQAWRHQCLLLRPDLTPPDIEAAVSSLVRDFDGRSSALGLMLGPDADDRRWSPALHRHGFVARSMGAAMARELDPYDLPRHAVPRGFTAHVVSEYIELAVARAIVGEVFNSPPLARNYLVDNPPFLPYLAEIDGVAVASATLIPSAGVAGIYSVATLPAYRGRGIATALVDQMVADATAQGFTVAALGCNHDRIAHYARSGFRVVINNPIGYLLE